MTGRSPPGAPALNCPGCKRKVADDTAICPHCDYIIDQSFLAGAEDGSGAQDDEETGVGPPPRGRPAAPPPARPKTGPTRARTGSRAAAPPPGDDATNVRAMEDIARERAQRPGRPGTGSAKAAAAKAAPARRAPAPVEEDEEEDLAPDGLPDPWSRASYEAEQKKSPIDDPEVLLDDARTFLRELQGPDRIAFWGAALVVLSCFMPWKETAEGGDFLGLISLGFISFLFGVAQMVFIGIRSRNLMSWASPMLPWGAQMVCSVICLGWSLVFLKLSSDTTLVPSPLGNAEMMNSSPSIGCFLGILGAVVAMLGCLMSLRQSRDY